MGEKIRKQKKLLALSFVLLLFLSIGFALLEQNLNITGTTIISNGSWSIHFVGNPTDSFSLSTGSVTGTHTYDTNYKSISFNNTLSIPGDFFEFTVDIINDGSVDAMLNAVPTLSIVDNKGKATTSDDSEYTSTDLITSIITYSDGIEPSQYDELKQGDTETIRVRIEFKKDIQNSDLENLPLHLTFNLNPVYVQSDNNAKEKNDTGCPIPISESSGQTGTIIPNANTLNKVMQDITRGKDASIDFTKSASETNTNGVYTRTTTINDKYPIYYYRGNVTNNNVIFNGFCWKIVRTTESGGVKMIYNGTPTNGVCPEIGNGNTNIGVGQFNEAANDPKYVGYMYKTTNENDTNSKVKTKIDSWYQTNFSGKTSENKIDNAVTFCNDRDDMTIYGVKLALASLYNKTIQQIETSYASAISSSEAAIANGTEFQYCPWFRSYTGQPSLICTNTSDNFGTSGHGNGKLTYPIGLLTTDEIMLAGNDADANNIQTNYNTSYYLYDGNTFWTGSPNVYDPSDGCIIHVVHQGSPLTRIVPPTTTISIRPVISLKFNTTYSSGNGTTTTPYIIN